jgi:HlyD family secretion protein
VNVARNRKKGCLIWGGAAVVVLVIVGALTCRPGRRVTQVQTALVSSGRLEQRATGSGRLEGLTRVEISASAMGLIDTIAVQEGDTVSRGDLLLALETDEASSSLDEARAAEYSASVTWTQADRARDRAAAMFDAGLASEEQTLAAREAAQTAWASVLRTRAGVDMAEDALGKRTYTAPIDGLVTALNVEQGEMAVVGTMNNPGTVLLTIEDMSHLIVRVTMVESEVVDVAPGMPAEITLDALPDTTFDGTVTGVGLSSTSASLTSGDVAEYEVTVELLRTDSRLRSGMSAQVEIITGASDSCLFVPVQCVVPRTDPADSTRDRDVVLRLSGGRVSEVPVETGIVGMMDIEVAGLADGDTVVSGPLEALRDLRDGEPVQTGEGRRGGGFGRGH